MMETTARSYSMADKSIILNFFLCVVIILLLLFYKGCKTANKETLSQSEIKKDSIILSQQRIINIAMDSVKILKGNLDSIKITESKIKRKWVSTRSIIKSAPDSSQYGLTKTLCNITNDSLPFKEINYCLADGIEASELLIQSKKENIVKDKQLVQMDIIIGAKDTTISAISIFNEELKKNNDSLIKDNQTQTRRKIFWRNTAIIITGVVVVIITFL